MEMPFTPLHLGPALLAGMILYSYLDFPTLVLASVIVDLEPLTILVLGLNQSSSMGLPIHWFFHSFLGGSLAALLTSVVMLRTEKLLKPIHDIVGLRRVVRRGNVLLAAFTGVYLHIVLDSILYTDIRPLFPLSINPFLGGMREAFGLWWLCVVSGLVGALLLFVRVVRARRAEAEAA